MASAADLIAALHWVDFETLVDLLLSRNGWHRVSALGDTQKDADLVVEQAVTGETALVQVKSAAAQATLDDYIESFDRSPEWPRLIFICHTPRGMLSVDRPDVLLWTRSDLAETEPHQSMKVPSTPPSHRYGRAAVIQPTLKARN